MKEIIDKLDFIKIKDFRSTKGNVDRGKTQATDRERVSAKDAPDAGLSDKAYKALSTFNNKKTINVIKEWAKDPDRHPIREDTQMAINA